MEYHEVRIVAERRKQGEHEGRGVPAQGHAPYPASHPRAPGAFGGHPPRTPLPVRDREEAMQYHQLRILCALRDKMRRTTRALPVPRLWTGLARG
jgi:hypothetical protein